MKLKGITITELIIVLTLFSILATLTMPVAVAQLQGNDAQATARQVLDYIFDAQQNAYSRKDRNTTNGNYKCYGISFADIAQRRIISFFADWNASTSTCGTRNEIYIPLSGRSAITPSVTEIYFIPGSLKPSSSANISLKNNNSTYTVYINDEGALYYQ